MRQPFYYYLIGVVLIISLALSGCGSHRGLQSPPAAQSEPVAAPLGKLDSVVVQPRRTILDKVLGRTPQPDTYVGQSGVKAGKKSTVSIYYGPATVTTNTVGKKAVAATAEGATATVIEKKAGPAVVASDSSTLNAIAGGGNLAAVNGDGNELEQKNTSTPKPGLLDSLKSYGMLLGAAGALALAIYFWPWLVAIWRRRPKNDTTA